MRRTGEAPEADVAGRAPEVPHQAETSTQQAATEAWPILNAAHLMDVRQTRWDTAAVRAAPTTAGGEMLA